MDLPYVSVCSGIGLLDLAVRRVFPTARPVCLVEREAFACEFLAQAMEDGRLDPAPICTDLRELRGSDLPRVELLFGGIPCQPHSLAGKRQGVGDERDLVDEFLRLAGELGPSLCFVENVSGFVSGDGLGRLLGGLASLGFDAEWGTLRASDIGAPHQRRRVFILAYRDRGRLESLWSGGVLDGERETLRGNTNGRHKALVFPPGPLEEWKGVAPKPCLCGVAHGGAPRVDALRALGNSVVPDQAERALRLLIERIL